MAAGKGRLHEVQSLLDGGRCKVNDEDEVCTSVGSELVYEDILLCVVCVCTYTYICLCVPTYVWLCINLCMFPLGYLSFMAASAFSRVHSILGVESMVRCGKLPPKHSPLPPKNENGIFPIIAI